MYGSHDVPLTIEEDGVSISVSKEGKGLLYRRKCCDEEMDKVLLTEQGKILVNPVEPQQKPKTLTPYFLIEFEKPVIVDPRQRKRIYLKFPIEIGVFITGRDEFKLLDVFTMMKQKFTLYGDVREGIICEHWKSPIFQNAPPVDPLKEGVVELYITNATSRWIELTRVVFNAYGMKIYYSPTMVSMRANMKVNSPVVAEVEFYDSPIYKDMIKSLELYTARKITMPTTKFVMEWGL
ncbi:MAG: DUF432 domain-containing protein [Thermoplasmata archaeon]|nr:MAG: DUF432 domain-containing protein [Thermoplasmata archaeon]